MKHSLRGALAPLLLEQLERAIDAYDGGCPADTRIGIDSQLLHYQELTIKSTFHHTPESIRKAFRLIADGHVDPNAFITSEAPLEGLPAVLGHLARGGDGLKTAILPWGRE